MVQQQYFPSLFNLDEVLGDILSRDPLHFVEHVRTVKGEGFKILGTGRDYLRGIYNYAVFDALRPGAKPMVVVKGRQVEFTETMLNICLYYLYHHNNITLLYAFPRGEQVSRFSSDRFDGAIRESQQGKLQEMFMRDGKKNVTHKQFKGNAQIFLSSAWGNADRLRGIPCDILIKDEVQDWTEEGIKNTRECYSQSKYKVDLAIGTPKGEGSYYHSLWNKSDKRYYHPRCIHCKELFRMTMEICTKLTFVQCPKCGVEQDKREAIIGGEWIMTGPPDAPYAGYHVSQLLHPNITIEDIRFKQKEYGVRKFRNEVLGEFAGGADQPLTPQEIVEMIEKERWHTPEFHYPPTVIPPEETVMGIDWGGHSEIKQSGAYTALTIVKPVSAAKFQVVFSKKITHPDHEKQVSEIKQLIYKYNCQLVVADKGYGHVQIQMLQKEFGPRIVTCIYASNVRGEVKYDPDTLLLTVDKDFALEDLYQEIKQRQWIIPLKGDEGIIDDPKAAEQEDYLWLIHHICNVDIVDLTKGVNPRKVFNKINRPCDGLHALNYSRLALMIKGHIFYKQISQGISSASIAPLLAYFPRRPR